MWPKESSSLFPNKSSVSCCATRHLPGGGSAWLRCVHTSQVADHSKSQSASHSGPDSGLPLLTAPPNEPRRRSPVVLSDFYHQPRRPPPLLAAYLPMPVCLPPSLTHTRTHMHTISRSFSLLDALAVLSRGLVSGSACYSPPALIKEENWNPFNQTARSPALPPPLQLPVNPPTPDCTARTGVCGGGGDAARRRTSHS